MSRAIVLGGRGLFGGALLEQLSRWNIPAISASRSQSADLRLDANDGPSLRANLRPGDLLFDAAGPFQSRSMALLDAALEIGCDLIDINDDLTYAEKVLARREKIDRAGISVFSSASSVSAITAAMVRQSGFAAPVRVTAFLAPASRHTANPGSALSLIQSVGRPVRVLAEGKLQARTGWSQSRRFPMPAPVGRLHGRLFESADAVYLPCIWPTLRSVEMYVDANTLGMNALLRVAARSDRLRHLLMSQIRLGTTISKWIGSSAGGLGYEIENADGQLARWAILSGKSGYLAAIAPAALAARKLANGNLTHCGLVLPDRHVEPNELFDYLRAAGMAVVCLGG